MNDNPAPPQLSAMARSYRIRYTTAHGERVTYATGLVRMQRLISLVTKLGYPYKAEII